MFADDVEIYNKSFNHDIVQMDINNMLKWSSNLCLYFDTNKCYVLHSGKKNTDCDDFMPIGEVDYKLNNSHSVKVLGVIFFINLILTIISCTSGRCNRQSEFTLLHFMIFHWFCVKVLRYLDKNLN